MPLYHVPAESLPGFLAFFNRHSINGKMTPNIIRGILAQRGICASQSEAQEVISSISIDGAGIDFQGFIDAVSSYRELRNPDNEYKSAFRLYDVKQKGALCKADVETMFAQMHLQIDVKKLFQDSDLDQDGFIDFEEFVIMMKKHGN